jgi:hypothetical protein
MNMTLNTYKVRLVNEMIGHERDQIVVVHAETDEDALDACFHFDEYAHATIIEENYAPEPDEPEDNNMTFRKLKEHAETEGLRDAIFELVIEMMKEDPSLDSNKVDRAFSLAWSDIEDEYIEKDYND